VLRVQSTTFAAAPIVQVSLQTRRPTALIGAVVPWMIPSRVTALTYNRISEDRREERCAARMRRENQKARKFQGKTEVEIQAANAGLLDLGSPVLVVSHSGVNADGR
jgi:hypothetical protein